MTHLEDIIKKTTPPETSGNTKTENTEKPEKQQEPQKSIPEVPVMQIKTLGKVPRKTRFTIVKGRDLLKLPIKSVSYMIDKILCEESLIYLAGPPGSFKTGLMIHVSLCGATGSPVLGKFKVNYRFKTLFLDEENGIRRTKHKFDRLVRGLHYQGTEEELDNIDFQCIKGFKLESGWKNELETLIEENEYKLIVIDNIARCMVGSEQNAEEVSKIQTLLKPLIEKYGITVVILHHFRKPNNEIYGNKHKPTLNDIRGSGDFGGQCDEAFVLDTWSSDMKTHIKTFNLYQVKNKDDMEMPGIVLKVEGDGDSPLKVYFHNYIEAEIESAVNKKIAELEGKIIEWLKCQEKKTHKTAEVFKEFEEKGRGVKKINRTHIRDALRELNDIGFIVWEKGTITFVETFKQSTITDKKSS